MEPVDEVNNVLETKVGKKEHLEHAEAKIKPTGKRYLILLIFCVCSMEKSFQWINLSAITNKVSLYYGVSNQAVNWTSLMLMVTFIPLLLPTAWLIERIGLRKAILIGSTGIALGAVIKCFSCSEDRFWVVMIGQLVVSLSEQFVFCVPPRIASVWFPDCQVALATGFGIFANQCGIALGFLIPQAILNGLETRQAIGQGLYALFLYTAMVAVVVLVVVIFLFDDQPANAPGAARFKKIQAELVEREADNSFKLEMKLFGALLYRLIVDRNSALLMVAYGINVGGGYTFQTLLNQMVTSKSGWSDPNRVVGMAGLVMVLSGTLGALFWGHLCDLTRRYILILRSLYLGTVIAIILFALTLRQTDENLLYAASSILGFNLIGYSVVGLDTIVEFTYPAPELMSTGIMSLSAQIFGTPILMASSILVDNYSTTTLSGFLVILFTLGFVITLVVRERLNRQNAVREASTNLRLTAPDHPVGQDQQQISLGSIA